MAEMTFPDYQLKNVPTDINSQPIPFNHQTVQTLIKLHLQLWGPFRITRQAPDPKILGRYTRGIHLLTEGAPFVGWVQSRDVPQFAFDDWVENITVLAEEETRRRFQAYPGQKPPPWLNFNAGAHFDPDDDYFRGIILSTPDRSIEDCAELEDICQRLARRYPYLGTSENGRALHWRRALQAMHDAHGPV